MKIVGENSDKWQVVSVSPHGICLTVSASTIEQTKRKAPPHAWKPGQSGNPSPRSLWKPGQSGNPKGRPKPEVDIAALARVHGPKCIQVVVKILSSKDEKMRLAAAIALLDRGFGRPKQEMDINSNSTIELHLVAARAISATLIDQQSTPDIPTIESTSTDMPTE
jgi:hypothetical protein